MKFIRLKTQKHPLSDFSKINTSGMLRVFNLFFLKKFSDSFPRLLLFASSETRLPAEFKHISKRRKRK